ncbi:hypothetical protein H0X32_03595 [Patescibacteria group bacterium]|nr:hypothetical protein [Patescibacteria group bacterium]
MLIPSNKTSDKAFKRAFTLIETIVVVSLLVVVGGALTSILQYFYRTNNYVLQEGVAVQSAQQGLATSIQDLREASYGDDGSYPISTVGTSSITFYADVNGNGNVDKVRYYLQNRTLYQGITYSAGTPPSYTGQPEKTSIVGTYVVNAASNPIFLYYDSSASLLTTPINVSQIASIQTTLQIDVDQNRSPSPYTLIGSATLRNVGH